MPVKTNTGNVGMCHDTSLSYQVSPDTNKVVVLSGEKTSVDIVAALYGPSPGKTPHIPRFIPRYTAAFD
jgi:hypothetical protein